MPDVSKRVHAGRVNPARAGPGRSTMMPEPSIANKVGAQQSRYARLRQQWWALPVAALLALFCCYILLFLHYRPYDIDNPWFLSFSYDSFIEHIPSDQFMDVRFPGGMDGTQFFGKLAAWLQYLVSAPAGWQQRPAMLLSAAFVTLGLGCWSLLLRRLGFGRNFIVCFLLAAGLSEPFFAAANKFRYEFLGFALISLALLLAVRGRPLLAGLCVGLAIETEPIAIIGLPALALLIVCSQPRLDRTRALALASTGLALAAIVYFALHPDIVHIRAYLAQSPAGVPKLDGGFFVAYFLHRLRHLPELLLFLIAGSVYWRRRHAIGSHLFGLGALAVTLFSIVMPHGNVGYMIFAYPFLVAMALIAFSAEQRPWLIAGCALLLHLPQQIYLTHLSSNLAYRAQDFAAVAQAIQANAHKLQLDDATLHVYGDYRLWFAHPHFYRAAAESTRADIAEADLFLCYDHSTGPPLLLAPDVLFCPALKAAVPLRLLDTVPLHNGTVFLYARKR